MRRLGHSSILSVSISSLKTAPSQPSDRQQNLPRTEVIETKRFSREMDLLPSKSLYEAARSREVRRRRGQRGDKGVADNKGSHPLPRYQHQFSTPIHRSDNIVGPAYKFPYHVPGSRGYGFFWNIYAPYRGRRLGRWKSKEGIFKGVSCSRTMSWSSPLRPFDGLFRRGV